MATSPREDKLTAWAFVFLGVPALIGGFVAGQQLEHTYPTESTITIAFVIVTGVIVIGTTFPVLRSKRRENMSQARIDGETAV